MRPLTGKTALVMASSRGLGRVIARTLATAGASVAINYHTSQEAAHSLVEELMSIGDNRHIAVGGDVSTAAGVASVIDAVCSRLAPLDILVNNAGPFSKAPFVDLEE